MDFIVHRFGAYAWVYGNCNWNDSGFDKIEAAGDMQPSLVAGGIKVALLTTVFGLSLQLYFKIFYNYIIAKIDSIVNDMEDASITLIDMLVEHKNK